MVDGSSQLGGSGSSFGSSGCVSVVSESSMGVGLAVTWVLGYNKLKQNEMTSNKNKNLVGGDERNKRVFLSLPSRFSVIRGFCERNVRGMSCRIASNSQI